MECKIGDVRPSRSNRNELELEIEKSIEQIFENGKDQSEVSRRAQTSHKINRKLPVNTGMSTMD